MFKILFFLFYFSLSGIFFSFPVYAQEASSTRSLQLWNHQVTYQLKVKNNPRWSSDGESFKKIIKGQATYFVVLNQAFIKKEAKQLFLKFEKLPKNPFANNQFNFPEWTHFEESLFTLKDSKFEMKNPKVKSTLKDLKEKLEYLAWFKHYEKSIQGAASQKEALENFIQQFGQIRNQTTEYHEAAHLIDLMKVNDEESKSAAFEKYSELNAFYTELAYSNNPYDTMAHAVVGLLDEMDQSKTKDYSIEKVSVLLRFLKENSRFAQYFRPDHKMAPCCFEVLLKISAQDFIFAGNKLYYKHLSNLKQRLASLG